MNTDRGTPAQGYLQIIDPTWRTYAAKAGVDTSQYPSAIDAPKEVQERVASVIPVNQWGPNTVRALKSTYGNIDTSKTLGELNSGYANAPSSSASTEQADTDSYGGGFKVPPGGAPPQGLQAPTMGDELKHDPWGYLMNVGAGMMASRAPAAGHGHRRGPHGRQ